MIKIRLENRFHRVTNSMKETVNRMSRRWPHKASIYRAFTNFATAMAKFKKELI